MKTEDRGARKRAKLSEIKARYSKLFKNY